MNRNKGVVPMVLALVAALVVTFLSSTIFKEDDAWKVKATEVQETSLIPQGVAEVLDSPHIIYNLYNRGALVAVITDYTKITELIQSVADSDYREEFPNAKLGLGEDLYIVEEMSYFRYNDVDSQIVAYLSENNYFSIEVDQFTFSNNMVIYVKDRADFEAAWDQYLLNFISASDLEAIRNNQETPELTGYGYRVLNMQVLESSSYSKGYTSKDNILMNKNEIIEYLSYGSNTTKKMYTVVEYDTIEGVASKNGLSAQQVVTINSDQLQTTNQLLAVGTQLNVTYFNPIITVVVQQEHVVQEPIYPDAIKYVEDPSLSVGTKVTEVEEQPGVAKVKYKETYVNGVLQESDTYINGVKISGVSQISYEVVQSPVQGVVRLGTKPAPGIGNGTFRFPVDNVIITCHYLCYYNHTAIDVQNMYNRYGDVYAADTGTVVAVGYNSAGGYYAWIDHGNGYRTYYGHFNRPAFVSVGEVVQKGQVIAQIGMTGRATGPHVHFAIEYNGARINPCSLLGC
ncbi:MAG: peptidoglycan DD-metalloendopeptidase family protein [Erysipelotrichaceae bacterium]|jgi:murein DD-endopeptidase MepM/ murein hydrolase activator NlpD|nr:peptidoglycan DD-metalloendopeptidase family protein [Erysipelotrichaceae bacterium]